MLKPKMKYELSLDRPELTPRRTIRDALILDAGNRGFKTKCIFEAELVVYSAREERIMEFHNLRTRLNRAGSYVGNGDLVRDPFSHLMLLVFDCLLVDDESLLDAPHWKRRQYLHQLISGPIPGRCEFAERRIIDFEDSDKGLKEVRELFAMGISKRWEGFVLKPCDGPYLGLGRRQNGRGEGFVGGKEAWIKLKKDYIQGLGDTADFCIIGVKPGMLSAFHVGCLMNKEDVQKFNKKPRFMVAFDVSYSIPKADLECINQLASFQTVPFKIEQFDLEFSGATEGASIQCFFPKPLVFELTGGGFHKLSGCAFYTPRHPRSIAEEALTAPKFESQEEKRWIEGIVIGDYDKRERKNMGKIVENVRDAWTKQRGLSMQESPNGKVEEAASLPRVKSFSVVEESVLGGEARAIENGVLKDIGGALNSPRKRSWDASVGSQETPDVVKRLRADYELSDGSMVIQTQVTDRASSEATPTPLKKLRTEFQMRKLRELVTLGKRLERSHRYGQLSENTVSIKENSEEKYAKHTNEPAA
ncbi:hypothetical protein RUND412_002116 [Rhizina undulata]